VKFLDDGSADRIGMFAFDDDGPTCAVDDFLHQYITAFVRSAVGLSDVFVAEIPEHILDYVLKFEPRKFV
jgi:hypothetical protein